MLWSDTATHEQINQVGPDGIKLQEAIFELIFTEKEYVDDLNFWSIVSDFFIQGGSQENAGIF